MVVLGTAKLHDQILRSPDALAVAKARVLQTAATVQEARAGLARLEDLASLRLLLRERRNLETLENGGADDNFKLFDTQQLAETLSSTMGVPSGYFPARRAARIGTIEALRHE